LKKKIIKDAMRKSYMNATYNRIRVGKSVLITGKFGSGKSTLLESLAPKRRTVIRVESLNPLPDMLASILQQMDHDVRPSWHRHMEHLELICNNARSVVLVIDEVNDMRPQIWPYIKRIMNADCPVVLAGLPSVRRDLQNKHEDILSRLKVLPLEPLAIDDLKEHHKDKFDADALELIHGAAMGNMRIFDEIADDCVDKIKELKKPRVDVETAAMFI
jgi:type II secretory pathway predicted ATPase ExeA